MPAERLQRRLLHDIGRVEFRPLRQAQAGQQQRVRVEPLQWKVPAGILRVYFPY